MTADVTAQPLTFGTAVTKTMEGAAEVKKDGNAFYYALKLGNYFTLPHSPVTPSPLRQMFGHGLAVIDLFDLGASIHYWLNGDWRNDGILNVFANASLGLSTAGGVVLWGAEIAEASLTIGTGLGIASLGLAAAGFGFLAIDACFNIAHADSPQKRTKGILDLISAVAHVALFILLMIPAISIWAIAVLGVIAAGFGLASILYKHFNEHALKQNQIV